MIIRIAGGQVLGPAGMMSGDVWIEDDTVVAVGADGPQEDLVIDTAGMFVGPGFVDLHAHLREPGHTWKEDIESGTRAAAVGGYTAVVGMPNTQPPIDNPEAARSLNEIGRHASHAFMVTASALTMGRAGVSATDAHLIHREGVRIFTDDGDSVVNSKVLAEVMRRIADLPGAVVAQHAEDPQMVDGGHLHLGEVSRALGLPGIPSNAETSIVERDLILAADTGARYHVQHVSSAATVDLIRVAKESGIRVTAEVTPHHLTFDEKAAATLDPNFKMYPPLRSADDREALVRGLTEGVIDAIATDHAPHGSAEKGLAFAEAARGVIGLETAAAAVCEVMSDPVAFFESMSCAPARIAGLARHGARVKPGSPANLVVFDPRIEWVPESFVSKSSNSPYIGRAMRGRAVVTILEGAVTHQMDGVA